MEILLLKKMTGIDILHAGSKSFETCQIFGSSGMTTRLEIVSNVGSYS